MAHCCPPALLSQSHLPGRSLCQVPVGAPAASAQALSALPVCAPCSYAATDKPLFSLISRLNWPHVFSSVPTGTTSLPAALLIPCPATAFCLSFKICQQLLFLPCWVRALSQSCLVSVPLQPPALLVPPDIFLHPAFPLSGSNSLPLHLNQLESLLSVLYYCARIDFEWFGFYPWSLIS